jgi:hypothetical protein
LGRLRVKFQNLARKVIDKNWKFGYNLQLTQLLLLNVMQFELFSHQVMYSGSTACDSITEETRQLRIVSAPSVTKAKGASSKGGAGAWQASCVRCAGSVDLWVTESESADWKIKLTVLRHHVKFG